MDADESGLTPAYFVRDPASLSLYAPAPLSFGAWCPLLQSSALGSGTSLLLFYFARRLLGATADNEPYWLEHPAIFNCGTVLMTIKHGFIENFFLIAAMLPSGWLWNPPKLSGFVVLAVTGLLDLDSAFFASCTERF